MIMRDGANPLDLLPENLNVVSADESLPPDQTCNKDGLDDLTPGVTIIVEQGISPSEPTPTTTVAGRIALTRETVHSGKDSLLTKLYQEHYRDLYRLSVLLVKDSSTAEDVVQDVFVAVYNTFDNIRDQEKIIAYLRKAVINRSRSALMQRNKFWKHPEKPPPDMPSAEYGALVLLERAVVIEAIRKLSERKRQAIVLRYYCDLPDAEVAEAMGVALGTVKSLIHQGHKALKAALAGVDFTSVRSL